MLLIRKIIKKIYLKNLKFLGMILNFDENIKEIFNKMDFMELMMQYEVKGSLSYVLSELNKINLPEIYFSSINMLVNIIDEFIDILCNCEFDDKNIDFFKHDEKPIYSESNALREEYLVQFIFNNTNLEKCDEINIYDPCCDNVNLIFNSIEFIKSKNNDCYVNFYGKLNFKNSIFDTTKVIIHSYLNDNNIFLSPSNKPGFPFEYISLEKMDFIISDYRAKNLYEDNHFLLHFQYEVNHPTKLVAIFDKNGFHNPFMDFAILNDNLESIITFHNSFILILNSNKLDDKKNKFLLVDYALSDNEFIYKIKYHHYSKSTNIENIPINHTHMDQILKSYANFTDTSFSKVILNNDAVKDYFHTESEKYWGYNSKCPNEVTKESNKKIEDRGGYSNLEKDMNYYLQEFNFNDLIYDLKNKSYSLVKQKYIGNELGFVEEKLEFVPLHSLITFDRAELNVENPNEYKIEKYGYSFYVNSYKILRNFLVYYLDSERVLAEII